MLPLATHYHTHYHLHPFKDLCWLTDLFRFNSSRVLSAEAQVSLERGEGRGEREGGRGREREGGRRERKEGRGREGRMDVIWRRGFRDGRQRLRYIHSSYSTMCLATTVRGA